jgi:hypothetical protein
MLEQVAPGGLCGQDPRVACMCEGRQAILGYRRGVSEASECSVEGEQAGQDKRGGETCAQRHGLPGAPPCRMVRRLLLLQRGRRRCAGSGRGVSSFSRFSSAAAVCAYVCLQWPCLAARTCRPFPASGGAFA